MQHEKPYLHGRDHRPGGADPIPLTVMSSPYIIVVGDDTGTFSAASGVPEILDMLTVGNSEGDWTGHVDYPTVLTVPEAGLYIVNGTIRWGNEVDTAFRSIFIFRNGSFETGVQGPKRSSETLHQSTTYIRYLTVGTTIAMAGEKAVAGDVDYTGAEIAVARLGTTTLGDPASIDGGPA